MTCALTVVSKMTTIGLEGDAEMNVNDIYPSKYVKAHDLGDKLVTVTIKSAVMENLGYGKEAERKLVIYFERAMKGLILNRTNAMIIASLYSPETDNWPGNAIILYSARIKAFGAWADAVRVKETIPARNVGAAQVPDALQEEPLDDENDLLDVDEGSPPRVDPETGEIVDAAANLPTTTDIIFERAAHPVHPVASQAQRNRMHALGMEYYHTDENWDKARPRWVRDASGGAVESSNDLSPEQVDWIITLLKQRIAKRVAANAQEPIATVA